MVTVLVVIKKVIALNESIQFTELGDFMIIRLKIFTYENGNETKYIPNMTIDQGIHKYDYFDLQGIIWHHGQSADFGHYTSNVKVNNIWYCINDTTISLGNPPK